jgi:hypothetical protein
MSHRLFPDLTVVSCKCKVEMLRLLVIGSLTFVPFKNVGLTAGTAPECDGGATRMISLCFEFRFGHTILYRSHQSP